MGTKLLSTTAEEIFGRSRVRKSLLIGNEDASIAMFIKREKPGTTTVSTTDHDHRIGPDGLITLNWGTDGIEAIQDRWTIIAASGTPRVSFFETEDIIR